MIIFVFIVWYTMFGIWVIKKSNEILETPKEKRKVFFVEFPFIFDDWIVVSHCQLRITMRDLHEVQNAMHDSVSTSFLFYLFLCSSCLTILNFIGNSGAQCTYIQYDGSHNTTEHYSIASHVIMNKSLM